MITPHPLYVYASELRTTPRAFLNPSIASEPQPPGNVVFTFECYRCLIYSVLSYFGCKEIQEKIQILRRVKFVDRVGKENTEETKHLNSITNNVFVV